MNFRLKHWLQECASKWRFRRRYMKAYRESGLTAEEFERRIEETVREYEKRHKDGE